MVTRWAQRVHVRNRLTPEGATIPPRGGMIDRRARRGRRLAREPACRTRGGGDWPRGWGARCAPHRGGGQCRRRRSSKRSVGPGRTSAGGRGRHGSSSMWRQTSARQGVPDRSVETLVAGRIAPSVASSNRHGRGPPTSSSWRCPTAAGCAPLRRERDGAGPRVLGVPRARRTGAPGPREIGGGADRWPPATLNSSAGDCRSPEDGHSPSEPRARRTPTGSPRCTPRSTRTTCTGGSSRRTCRRPRPSSAS